MRTPFAGLVHMCGTPSVSFDFPTSEEPENQKRRPEEFLVSWDAERCQTWNWISWMSPGWINDRWKIMEETVGKDGFVRDLEMWNLQLVRVLTAKALRSCFKGSATSSKGLSFASSR